MITTPPWIVLLPSGMDEPDETQAAIWKARRLFPQPWSASSRLMPARERRWGQRKPVGWSVAAESADGSLLRTFHATSGWSMVAWYSASSSANVGTVDVSNDKRSENKGTLVVSRFSVTSSNVVSGWVAVWFMVFLLLLHNTICIYGKMNGMEARPGSAQGTIPTAARITGDAWL